MILRTLIIAFLGLFWAAAFGQNKNEKESNRLITAIESFGGGKEVIRNAIEEKIGNPDTYNFLWQKLFILQVSSSWKFLNDLNVEFKTFQNVDSAHTSLGVFYDLKFNYDKVTAQGQRQTNHSFNFKSSGNVAFNKRVNPNNFLETSINYSLSRFMGGVIVPDDTTTYSKLNDLSFDLAMLDDMNGPEAQALWDDFDDLLKLTDQYYYLVNPIVGFESNQDFSISQITFGLTAGAGLKSWRKGEGLSWLNILDYPFALIRWISGIEPRFSPYGSTLPAIQAGFDYVIPQNDDLRQELFGNLDPFPRIRFETGFRTFVSEFKNQRVHFTSSLKYYHELNPHAEIKAYNLDEQLYFVMTLQSSTGIYIGYAAGNLPFDAQKDEIYSIGFNYSF